MNLSVRRKNSYESRVEAGMAFFDRHYPNWIDAIKIESIEVSIDEDCPGCQVTNCKVFAVALAVMGIGDEQAIELGIFLPGVWKIEERYAALTDIWKRMIEEKLLLRELESVPAADEETLELVEV